MNEYVHKPVLLEEVLHLLRPEQGGTFVDATLGLGGHAEAFLDAAPSVRLIGIDTDPRAIARARVRLDRFAERFVAVEGRYEDIASHLQGLGLETVDGVLADLGVSSMQLDDPERGFSFRRDGPLDMRMGTHGRTAAELVAELSRHELERIFRQYGEEMMSGRIARSIDETRKESPIVTTSDLRNAILRAVGSRYQKIDPATRVFQALRIATNHELTDLTRFLDDSIEKLRPGARLAVLSYHSLEDRIVKAAFVRHATGCICPPSFPVCACGREKVMELVTRKAIRPSDAETARNPRSRSARLRVIERTRQA